MLIASIVIAGIGLLYCIAMHIFMYFSIWYPSHIIPIILNIGMGALFFYIAFISKRWRKSTGENLFKCLIKVLPKLVKVLTISISAFGLFMFVFYFIDSYSDALDEVSAVQLTLNKFYRSFSALLMVFYVIEFAILYSYSKLLKLRQVSCVNGHTMSPIETWCKTCGFEPEKQY